MTTPRRGYYKRVTDTAKLRDRSRPRCGRYDRRGPRRFPVSSGRRPRIPFSPYGGLWVTLIAYSRARGRVMRPSPTSNAGSKRKSRMHVAFGVFRPSAGVVRSGCDRESACQSSAVVTDLDGAPLRNHCSAATANLERLGTSAEFEGDKIVASGVSEPARQRQTPKLLEPFEHRLTRSPGRSSRIGRRAAGPGGVGARSTSQARTAPMSAPRWSGTPQTRHSRHLWNEGVLSLLSAILNQGLRRASRHANP